MGYGNVAPAPGAPVYVGGEAQQATSSLNWRYQPQYNRHHFSEAQTNFNGNNRGVGMSVRRRPAGRRAKRTQWIDRTGRKVEAPDFEYEGSSGQISSHEYRPAPEGKFIPGPGVGSEGNAAVHIPHEDPYMNQGIVYNVDANAVTNRTQQVGPGQVNMVEQWNAEGGRYRNERRNDTQYPVAPGGVQVEAKPAYHQIARNESSMWQEQQRRNQLLMSSQNGPQWGQEKAPEGYYEKNSPSAYQNLHERRLGPICEQFLSWYSANQPSDTIVVEDIARVLNENFKRVADVMEILANLGIVSKMGPQNYDWQGLQGLQQTIYSLTRGGGESRGGSFSTAGMRNAQKAYAEGMGPMHGAAMDISETLKHDTKANASRSRNPEAKDGNIAGSFATQILELFVAENTKMLPFVRIVSHLTQGETQPTEEYQNKCLYKIRDAVDVLGALELVEMVESGNDNGDSMALVWIGSNILHVQEAPTGPAVKNEMSLPSLERKRNVPSTPNGTKMEKGASSDSAKQTRRYLKKSLAAMKRRRIGGRFATSVEKRSTEHGKEHNRSFFALSRDEQGIHAVSYSFQHSAWSYHHGRVGLRSCRCVKSRCESRYCDCFASGTACLNCNCKNCGNTHRSDKKRRLSSRGCKCMKSHCSKGHCDCFAAGKGCSSRCECLNCENPIGSKHTASNESNDNAPSRMRLIQPQNDRLAVSKISAFRHVGVGFHRDLKREHTIKGEAAKGPPLGPKAESARKASRASRSRETKRTSPRQRREWHKTGHSLIGKEYLRDNTMETGKVHGWLPQGREGSRVSSLLFLVRYENGETEECDEASTRRGVQESSFKPGKRVKVLHKEKWVLGTLTKVSRSTKSDNPFGVKIDTTITEKGKEEGKLVWAPRTLLRHVGSGMDSGKIDGHTDRVRNDGFSSDTTPNETVNSCNRLEAVVDPLADNDADSDSTSAQELVDRCYVPKEEVEWKFGSHWIKAKVIKRESVNSKRRDKREVYSIRVLSPAAIKSLGGHDVLPAVDERFLRPLSDDAPIVKLEKKPVEYKKRAPRDDEDLIIKFEQVTSDVEDIPSKSVSGEGRSRRDMRVEVKRRHAGKLHQK
eukprot:CAMPEP_0114525148 /NCGR_PEP_ID=MMETSP0109-20121206/22255_1 /TAXON_ID=29199 /ORGANISM="Chlorarachnion reptans, Strain CCCM449" /LENGTH=1090 /DNA_ID=CAMNT_0001706681 /DNA_START=140 /DNA_END=3412 /DNA_ORIENTATION=+